MSMSKAFKESWSSKEYKLFLDRAKRLEEVWIRRCQIVWSSIRMTSSIYNIFGKVVIIIITSIINIPSLVLGIILSYIGLSISSLLRFLFIKKEYK